MNQQNLYTVGFSVNTMQRVTSVRCAVACVAGGKGCVNCHIYRLPTQPENNTVMSSQVKEGGNTYFIDVCAVDGCD